MEIYGLKNCDTCRRALKDLLAAGYEAVLIDVRQNGLTPAALAQLFTVFGQDLVNRRSTTWRNLSEDERSREPVALLLKNPSLMKRPVIMEGDGVPTLGWSKDVQKQRGIKVA